MIEKSVLILGNLEITIIGFILSIIFIMVLALSICSIISTYSKFKEKETNKHKLIKFDSNDKILIEASFNDITEANQMKNKFSKWSGLSKENILIVNKKSGCIINFLIGGKENVN